MLQHVGGRSVDRKYIRMYACPWLDLMENMEAIWACLYKPLQNVPHHYFLGTLDGPSQNPLSWSVFN